MNLPVRFECDVVETSDFNPIAEVRPTIFGVEYGRPSNCQRMHAVLVFQDMSRECTVFPAAARKDTVIISVIASILGQ